MMTLLIAVGSILIPLSIWRAYRIGFRDGREQGYSESFQLFGGMRGTPEKSRSNKQEPEGAIL